MTNLIYHGKIDRQLQGKLICHFYETSGLQNATWGVCFLLNSYLSNKITFFHHGIRAG